MKKLIVSATLLEIEPFLEKAGHKSKVEKGVVYEVSPAFDILVTGVGMMASAYSLGSLFAKRSYELVINAGIAGSFKEAYPPECLVHVREEILGDFGSEDTKEGFKEIFDLRLLDRDEPPFSGGKLVSGCSSHCAGLPGVRAVTVNRVLAHSQSIDWIKKRFDPDIVSMEGASVFYACIKNSTPCVQFRAVSDMAGNEDRSLWKIRQAVSVLCNHLTAIYEGRV